MLLAYFVLSGTILFSEFLGTNGNFVCAAGFTMVGFALHTVKHVCAPRKLSCRISVADEARFNFLRACYLIEGMFGFYGHGVSPYFVILYAMFRFDVKYRKMFCILNFERFYGFGTPKHPLLVLSEKSPNSHQQSCERNLQK